jgi:hypothetical protein
MAKKVRKPMSSIPTGLERRVEKKRRVDLLSMIQLLLEHLTPALCQGVFEQHRTQERERKWTFYAVNQFWAAMIVRHPPSITNGLDQTRKGRGKDKLWPRVMAVPRAFFKKCEGLRWNLFKGTYEAFTTSILSKAPMTYASWMSGLRKHFPEIHVVDGSRLDAICHRLKILYNERAPVLPGCLTVFYDLYRGITRQVLFYPNAAAPELPRAQEALSWITKGALLLGDRLYASVQYFHWVAQRNLFGLFRLHGRLSIKRLKVLSRRNGRAFLEDVLVEVGSGQKHPKVTLRLIRYRGEGHRLYLLTSVLDPALLSAEEAVSLYGLRWSIERMFLDIKETLDLHCLYASHPNLVAQQVYAAAIVHTAFRVAQSRIAKTAKVLPEQISPAKLFPKLAQAANDYCVAQIVVIKTKKMNRGVKIQFPGWHTLPSAYTTLGAVLVEHRNSHRRHRRFCLARKRWKSFAHVAGGPTLLKSASVG